MSSSVGISYSVKAAREYGYANHEPLMKALTELGCTRFRLMTYWDEIEKEQGKYDFRDIKRQLKLLDKYIAKATVCLGMRQPRWPETHLPTWAAALPLNERYEALYAFLEKTLHILKDNPAIISWQLENEAFNRGFGEHGDFSRQRLVYEHALVKRIDPKRPVIMTTSDSWGLPLRRPRPDIIGFSVYKTMHTNGTYHRDKRPALFYRTRSLLIRCTTRRKSFIHELQLEPWGPSAVSTMSLEEQYCSMSHEQFRTNIGYAVRTRLRPIDCWGIEWWYWLHATKQDSFYWTEAKKIFYRISMASPKE
jgi:hypothetical protein